jgi:hypothetical protein
MECVSYRLKLSDPSQPHSQTSRVPRNGQYHAYRPDKDAVSGVRWSPDGRRAFFSATAQSGLMVANPDGTEKPLSPRCRTNHPLPATGERLARSPDGSRIAPSATPGPEPDANGDPMIIGGISCRAESGSSVRLTTPSPAHAVADLATRRVTPHGRSVLRTLIDWSPRVRDPTCQTCSRILIAFNYDLFSVRR